MITNKKKYKRFCLENDFIPVFSQPWWMDAVCADGYWDVLLYEKDGDILGALPYYVKKKWGISYITQPKFTQYNGVIIKYPNNQKYEKKLSYEKEIMTALIEQLEKLPIVFYQQFFDLKFTNWLPFYWKGYRQNTCYTYRISDISNIERVYTNMHVSKRRDYKVALQQNLHVNYDMPISVFYEYHKNVLKESGEKINYSFKFIDRLWNTVIMHKSGVLISVCDDSFNIHSFIMLVWDKSCAYNLMTAISPKYRKSYSSGLLFYEAIKHCSLFVSSFDFEGSMIESIENSYRKFGTIQLPYFFINKIFTKNLLIRLLVTLKIR